MTHVYYVSKLNTLFTYLYIYLFTYFLLFSLRPRHRQRCWLVMAKGLDSSSLLLHHPSFSFWLHYPLNLLWSPICYRHPVNLTHCNPQQVSYTLTDIRIRFKIIVWVTHVYHRVISIAGKEGRGNLDNLNDCSQWRNVVCGGLSRLTQPSISVNCLAVCFMTLSVFRNVHSNAHKVIAGFF
jgi:hypothetical protein